MGASKRLFMEERQELNQDFVEVEQQPLEFELCIGCHGKAWVTIECKNESSYSRIHDLINNMNATHICDHKRRQVHVASESIVRNLIKIYA